MATLNSSTFEACKVDICEEPGFFTGAQGVCNNITGLCECPEGFSGWDVWAPSKSCEVSDNVARVLSYVLLVETVLTIIVGFYFFLITFVRLGYYKEIKNTFSLNSQPSESIETTTLSGIMERELSPSMRTLGRKKKKSPHALLERRKKWMVATMGLLAFNPVLHLPFTILLVLEEPVYRYEVAYALDIPTSIALAIIPTSLWMVAYVYYMTLPSLERLRKILQVESFLFNRDKVFPLIILFHAETIITFYITVLGILPSTRPNDIEFFRMLVAVFCYFTVGITIESAIVTYSICLLLRRIYTRALNLIRVNDATLHAGQAPSNTKKLEEAIHNLMLLGLMVPFALITGVPPMLILSTPAGQRQAYVWYFYTMSTGYGFVGTANYILSREHLSNKSTSSSTVELERAQSLSEDRSSTVGMPMI